MDPAQDLIVSTPAADAEKQSPPENSKDKPLSAKDDRMVLSVPSQNATPENPSRGITEDLGSLATGDHNAVYQPNIYSPQAQTFYYGGYDNPSGEWGEYRQYFTAENMDIGSPGVYNDNPSLVYHSGYGYNPQIPYGPYSPVTTSLSSARGDGQLYPAVAQQFPFSGTSYYQQLVPPNTQFISSSNPGLQTDMTVPVGIDQQGDSMLFGTRPGYSPQFGSFGRGSSFPVNSDGQRSLTPLSSHAALTQPFSKSGSFGRHAGMASQQQRPLYGIGYGSGSSTRHYQHNGIYQNSGFETAPFSTLGANDRWSTLEKVRRRTRDTGPLCSCNAALDLLSEQNRGPRASKPKNEATSERGSSADHIKNGTAIVEANKEPYNRSDFVTEYSDAKFFVIKSYSEDNVHKSIKYGVWASTPNGNRKLDAAYHEAQEKQCPVFLLFSVNASAQFCGVAEMIGPVDFDKSVDYWQQDKWSGQFPVKWHIVKDVPNSQFRHIILENNDNKPVTNSRDTQEVILEHGLEMLIIFKNYETNLSILDDFDYYEEREKAMQERKARQQATLMAASVVGGSNEYRSPVTLTNDFVKQMSKSFAQAVRLNESNNERTTEKSEAEVATSVDSVAKADDTSKLTVLPAVQTS